MIRGRDKLQVKPAREPGEPEPATKTVRAHVSWEDGEEVKESSSAVSVSYVVTARRIVATYGPSTTIADNSVVTYKGNEYKPIGPEELHTDMQGREHHKTRRLESRVPK